MINSTGDGEVIFWKKEESEIRIKQKPSQIKTIFM